MGGTSRPKKWGEYGDWLGPFSRRLYKLPWVAGWKSHSGHGSNIGGEVSVSTELVAIHNANIVSTAMLPN
jgi:hypothetical protein